MKPERKVRRGEVQEFRQEFSHPRTVPWSCKNLLCTKGLRVLLNSVTTTEMWVW